MGAQGHLETGDTEVLGTPRQCGHNGVPKDIWGHSGIPAQWGHPGVPKDICKPRTLGDTWGGPGYPG